jgi:hypothetical protein
VTLAELLATATPGRWFYDSYATVHSSDLVAQDADETGVARVWGGTSRFNGGTATNPSDARLIALAPELARLALDMGEALRKTIYSTPGWTGPDVWWKPEADALLARLERITDSRNGLTSGESLDK